jgi:hypothetical protein
MDLNQLIEHRPQMLNYLTTQRKFQELQHHRHWGMEIKLSVEEIHFMERIDLDFTQWVLIA